VSRVHATKLEQLVALHARIRALVSAVGEDFFPPDLLSPVIEVSPPPDKANASAASSATAAPKMTARSTRASILAINSLASTTRHPDLTLSALGPVLPNGFAVSTSMHLNPNSVSPTPSTQPPPYDPSIQSPPLASDYTPPADVSPAHFARIDKELQRAKLAITERRSQLARTLLHASWLMLEMGMELPSEEDGWDDETREDVTEGDRTFVKFLRGLVDAEAEMEAAGECVGDAEDGMRAAMRAVERVEPRPEILAWAAELVSTVRFAFCIDVLVFDGWLFGAQLEAEQSSREQRIQELYNQLAPLWTRLSVPSEEVEAFIERNQGCSESSVLAVSIDDYCMRLGFVFISRPVRKRTCADQGAQK
jgi:hypothetical protein